MSIDISSDAVWEAVAAYIFAQVGTSLSLKSCEQGNYLQLPPAEDLSDILPFVLVDAHEAPGRMLPGFGAVEMAHRVVIHYVCKISDTQTGDRVTRAGRDAIANLYAQPPFEGGTALPGWTPSARTNIFARSALTLRILDTFTEVELPIGHGTVEMDVVLHHFST